MKRLVAGLVLGGALIWIPTAVSATPSPNGPGQPGAPNTTCGSTTVSGLAIDATPGGSASAPGSPFDANGVSGTHYAGNPGTASSVHSNSSHSVSQYDIACFQNTLH